MFHFEKAIADWRKQMLAAGVKTPVPLEELESHLREEIEQQMKAGLNVQPAFEIAVQEIGKPGMLKREFKKMERTLMKRIAIILLGIFAVLFGPGIVLPALAKHRDLGVWNSDIVTPIVLGTIITLVGLGVAVVGFKRRKA